MTTLKVGIATWIVPPVLWLALSWRQSRSYRRSPPAQRSPRSLAAVGLVIFVFIVAVYLSAIGTSLAVLTLVLSPVTFWAWLALAEIAAFWVSVGVVLAIGDRSRQARKRPT